MKWDIFSAAVTAFFYRHESELKTSPKYMSPIYYYYLSQLCTFLMYSGCECTVVQYARWPKYIC